MTENKQLKARVRSRMARTGESYTTAHRHVVAGATPPGLLPGYPTGSTPTHRPSALASRMLRQAGAEIDETTACGLGGGIGFMYAVFEYRQLDHPLLTIVMQHHPQAWSEAVAQHLGLPLRTQHSSSPRAARARLDAELAAGRAAELLVARGGLPWHADVPELEAAEPYPVVVAGARDDRYLVDDLGPRPEEVPADVLVAAWAAHRKGRFALATFEEGTGADRAGAVRAALGTTSRHLTGPVLGNAFDVNFGLSGMAKLATELRDARTRHGWAARFGDEPGFRYAMGRLAECLTSAYTARGGTRPLYAGFVRAAASTLGRPGLTAAADALGRSGDAWEGIADDARRAATGPWSSAAANRALAGLADRVGHARELEEAAVADLERALG